MNNFIDIHCHILPGMDDGPPDRREAEKMLALACADGISGIVATPHMLDNSRNNTKEAIGKALEELRHATRGVELYIGAEIRIGADFIQRSENGELPLINNKNFLLLELPPYVIPPIEVLENIVRDLKMKRVTPVFSHPERNMPLCRDLSIMKRLLRCGALFQVTAMSILAGGNMAKKSLDMIGRGYVHVVASDAHDSLLRPPVLSESHAYISKKFGKDLARKLFTENPLKIIQGQQVD